MTNQLIESANKQGYVVKSIEDWGQNQFGKQHIIVIEGGQFRIKFNTNVLHGVNYFFIHEVTDYLQGRTYKASRFHHKFISLITQITGDTHIQLKDMEQEAEEIEDIEIELENPLAIIRQALDLLPIIELDSERDNLYRIIQDNLSYQEVTKTHVMEVWCIFDNNYFDKETAELFEDGKEKPQLQYIIVEAGDTVQEGTDDFPRYDSYEDAMEELKTWTN